MERFDAMQSPDWEPERKDSNSELFKKNQIICQLRFFVYIILLISLGLSSIGSVLRSKWNETSGPAG